MVNGYQLRSPNVQGSLRLKQRTGSWLRFTSTSDVRLILDSMLRKCGTLFVFYSLLPNRKQMVANLFLLVQTLARDMCTFTEFPTETLCWYVVKSPNLMWEDHILFGIFIRER